MSCFPRLHLSRLALQGRFLLPSSFASTSAARYGRNVSQPTLRIQSNRLAHTLKQHALPEPLASELHKLIGPLEESNDGILSKELVKQLARDDIDLRHSETFMNLVKSTRESCILQQLLSCNQLSTAAFIITSLLKHSNETARLVILDNCGHLLARGNTEVVFDIFMFWRDHFDFSYSEELPKDPLSLAGILISLACDTGKPLLAASLCLRLDQVGLLHQESLQKTVSLLLISHPSQNQYFIKAISELHIRLKTTPLELTTKQKGQLLQLSAYLSHDKFPSMINDTYNLAQNIPGGDVPISILFKIIKDNLRYNNTSRAALIAREITKRQLLLDQYDLEVLGLMIREFSKTRKYLDIAHYLVGIIPDDYFTIEGLTEVLLSYCARTKNQDLAVRVYSKLEAPIPRSVLTSLLHLHISFGDNGGAEKILLEIARRNDAIRPVEFGMIVQAALQQSLDKAAGIARKNSPHVAKLAYGSIINAAIEEGNMEVADEFIDLAYENLSENDRMFDTISSLIIKKILKTENSREARLQWLQWKSQMHLSSKIRLPNRSVQIINLRAIADKAMEEGDTSVVNWTIQELRHLGMHMSDIRKELSKRSQLKNITSQFLKPS